MRNSYGGRQPSSARFKNDIFRGVSPAVSPRIETDMLVHTRESTCSDTNAITLRVGSRCQPLFTRRTQSTYQCMPGARRTRYLHLSVILCLLFPASKHHHPTITPLSIVPCFKTPPPNYYPKGLMHHVDWIATLYEGVLELNLQSAGYDTTTLDR